METKIKLEIKYSKGNLGELKNAIKFLSKVYSDASGEDQPMIVPNGYDNKEYRKDVVPSKNDIDQSKPLNSSIKKVNPYRRGLNDKHQKLYDDFLKFVDEECVVQNDTSTKVLAQELVRKFSDYVGNPIDNRTIFPSFMAQLIELYPFIVKKCTAWGVLYTGISLKSPKKTIIHTKQTISIHQDIETTRSISD